MSLLTSLSIIKVPVETDNTNIIWLYSDETAVKVISKKCAK